MTVAPPAQAQTLTTFHNFQSGGLAPSFGVTQGGLFNLRIFGFTTAGGTDGLGTIYSLFLANGSSETTLHDLSNATGTFPQGGIAANNAFVYGATGQGGTLDSGVAFRMQINGGGYTVLHEFGAGSDGKFPIGVIFDGGYLYGTTEKGGTDEAGTVFKIDATTGSVMWTYPLSAIGGSSPRSGVIKIGNFLYGTTQYGGSHGDGTVYKIKTDGTAPSIVHSFDRFTEGDMPSGDLVHIGGVLYGTTYRSTFVNPDTGGTVFKVGLNGANFATLHFFDLLNGESNNPIHSALTELNGMLYGTTAFGGASGNGTVYGINPSSGAYTLLYSFTGGADGGYPIGTMVDIGGVLYGTARFGGSDNHGTVFQFTP